MKDSSNKESSTQNPSFIEERNKRWEELAKKKGAKLVVDESPQPFAVLNVSPDFVRRYKEWEERQRRTRSK
jgi:hypothetical protein